MRIAFFDSKPYDVESFGAYEGSGGLTFKFFETKLTPDSVSLPCAVRDTTTWISVTPTASSV